MEPPQSPGDEVHPRSGHNGPGNRWGVSCNRRVRLSDHDPCAGNIRGDRDAAISCSKLVVLLELTQNPSI